MRSYCQGGKGNELCAFEDYPKYFDNWEITNYYKQKRKSLNDIISVEKILGNEWGNSIDFEEHRAYVNLYYSPAGQNKSEVWLREYPDVCNILNDQPNKPKYNSVYNNICVSTNTPDVEFTARWYAKKISNNVSTTESKIKGAFYDYSNNKFEVINQSTLNGIVAGFEYPDFNMIGILR